MNIAHLLTRQQDFHPIFGDDVQRQETITMRSPFIGLNSAASFSSSPGCVPFLNIALAGKLNLALVSSKSYMTTTKVKRRTSRKHSLMPKCKIETKSTMLKRKLIKK